MRSGGGNGYDDEGRQCPGRANGREESHRSRDPEQ